MKKWLSDQGISYRQLATVMGMSPSAVCKRVNGQVPWTGTDLLLLHRQYGLSSDFVLDIEPIQTEKNALLQVGA